ncbi:MAG: M15 family metallopeptidase, partial [Acidimicrobiales bacterium]
QASIEMVTVEQLGASWKPDMGCLAPGQLRAVNVSHWGYDGAVHTGRIIVAEAEAERMMAVFGDVYAARFPIERMVPIDAYGGDDQASMRANNTSGFNCRSVGSSSTLSQHGLGLAVDVNPLMNPYVKGSAVDPPEGARWADRSRTDAGMIKPGGPVVDAFDRQGWAWGGYWSSGQDYQHFSANGG